MNKKTIGLIVIVILLVIAISLLMSKDVQKNDKDSQEKMIVKPNITTQEIISELQNIKDSMNEINRSLSS